VSITSETALKFVSLTNNQRGLTSLWHVYKKLKPTDSSTLLILGVVPDFPSLMVHDIRNLVLKVTNLLSVWPFLNVAAIISCGESWDNA